MANPSLVFSPPLTVVVHRFLHCLSQKKILYPTRHVQRWSHTVQNAHPDVRSSDNPTSETPPIHGSSNASVRSASRASVGQQQYWKSLPHSPVNTTFTIGGNSSNRSSGATGWRVDVERRVSGGAGMRALHHQQSSLGDGNVASRRMNPISSSYSVASFSDSIDCNVDFNVLDFNEYHVPLVVGSRFPTTTAFVLVFHTPTSVNFASTCRIATTSFGYTSTCFLTPPPRHSLASSSSLPSSNITNATPTATITDDEPLLPPPTTKPPSSWNRVSLLERQFDLVQQQAEELREVRDRQGWDSGTDEGHGGAVGSHGMSVDGHVGGEGSVKGSPAWPRYPATKRNSPSP